MFSIFHPIGMHFKLGSVLCRFEIQFAVDVSSMFLRNFLALIMPSAVASLVTRVRSFVALLPVLHVKALAFDWLDVKHAFIASF